MNLTPEELFKEGAEAMRSKLIALAMMDNNFLFAQKIISLPIPEFRLAEKQKIN